MTETKMNIARMQRVLCVFATLLLPGIAFADDLQQKLGACAEIENNDERLACFDALALSKRDQQYRVDDDVATTASTDDSAAPQAKSPTIIAEEDETFDVRLIRCSSRSAGGRQVYYFDNGEVWQQSNSSPTKIHNCDTDVRIRQDLFGYKMEVPSENRRIRIRPVR